MKHYRLAQINFARLRVPLTDPKMAGYVKLLREVNALAEASPGFIWRMDEASASSSGDRAFPKLAPGTTLVNLSVWKSVGALRRHVQFGVNNAFNDTRQSWFHRFEGRWIVLWWVPDGYFPEVADGWERLQHLRKHGETGYAFNLVRPFPPPPNEEGYQPLPPRIEPEALSPGDGSATKPVAARRIGIPVLPWYLDW